MGPALVTPSTHRMLKEELFVCCSCTHALDNGPVLFMLAMHL
jgi:hypothetical protein